jgi:adenosylcobinamide-GDP ribazoletransferase
MSVIKAIGIAIGFLTRVPVNTGATEAKDLANATVWFPVVGLALGAVSLGMQHVLTLHVGSTVSAVAIVAVSAMLTGGLHLDGVADLFDALGGGRGNRERMLEIMRDSRIGAHGATALMLVLAAKIALVDALLNQHNALPLLLAPSCARWITPLLMKQFPYARETGLGRGFHDHVRWHHVLIATLFFGIALATFAQCTAWAAGISMLMCLLLCMRVAHLLSGLTGDVYGAAIELAEACFLFVALF